MRVYDEMMSKSRLNVRSSLSFRISKAISSGALEAFRIMTDATVLHTAVRAKKYIRWL